MLVKNNSKLGTRRGHTSLAVRLVLKWLNQIAGILCNLNPDNGSALLDLSVQMLSTLLSNVPAISPDSSDSETRRPPLPTTLSLHFILISPAANPTYLDDWTPGVLTDASVTVPPLFSESSIL